MVKQYGVDRSFMIVYYNTEAVIFDRKTNEEAESLVIGLKRSEFMLDLRDNDRHNTRFHD